MKLFGQPPSRATTKYREAFQRLVAAVEDFVLQYDEAMKGPLGKATATKIVRYVCELERASEVIQGSVNKPRKKYVRRPTREAREYDLLMTMAESAEKRGRSKARVHDDPRVRSRSKVRIYDDQE